MTGFVVLFLFSFLLISGDSCAHSLCTNSSVPFNLDSSMEFCSYNGSVCCDSSDILQLKKEFQSLKVDPDSECASLMQSILCAKCDQFSAELFRIASSLRTVPVLCNSTSQSQHGASSIDFCTKVWETCGNTPISNSPFCRTIQGKASKNFNRSACTISDHWKSRSAFCESFGGSSLCFSGDPVTFNKVDEDPQPDALCLERIGTEPYLNLIAHPDGSDRVFLSNQHGKIWLANVPLEGPNMTLEINESKPFLDISDQVLLDSSYGLMGMAFHPNFTRNGRFFLSFNCDKLKQPRCSGRCTCNTDVDCDPSLLKVDDGAQPCQYHNVVAEYTVNGTASNPSLAEIAYPLEVRRILTMGLPYRGHAGQLLFGPVDGYLYIMVPDVSNGEDPLNLAQNKVSLIGKILRIDIDNIPSAKQVQNLGLWGNYSVPKDNPYVDDKELGAEIWALGFRNTWRCSFDAERPYYFLCGECGQDQYEEIDVIKKGGNYGWQDYEGPYIFASTTNSTKDNNTSLKSTIYPVMGYDHSELGTTTGSASVTGGYFYRSKTDPCMYGRYVYADLYGGAMWAGTETPENSGNFSSVRLKFSCAKDSPIPCSFVGGSDVPVLGYILSFGEDRNKDLYLLASSGVYRVARPSRCNYSCSKEMKGSFVTREHHSHSSSTPTKSLMIRGGRNFCLILFCFLVLTL